MKKTMVSLAAVAALTTGAFAADKGIDIVTTGQAVVYYQTTDSDAVANSSLFNQDDSVANVGVQLNFDADLKNDFTFGSQLTYLNTAGLENNLVGNVAQNNSNTLSATAIGGSTTDDIMLTKIFVAKKIANTTVKIGRQELPASLSPLAFTESYSAFNNTFDAIVAVNTDLPNTTVVAAYVSGSNTAGDLGTMQPLQANGALAVNSGAYMLTAQTTVIPMTTLTATYYSLQDVATTNDADAYWVDAQITDKGFPMGLTVGLQYGNISPDTVYDDTTAYGIKASIQPMETLTLSAAYTSVDNDGAVTVTNVGGGDSPLYTQIDSNGADIGGIDNDSWMLSAGYSLGEMGDLTVAYADTDSGLANNDMSELDLVYTVAAAGVDYLVAYVMINEEAASSDSDTVRVVARYNF
jgi:hypothetical protein